MPRWKKKVVDNTTEVKAVDTEAPAVEVPVTKPAKQKLSAKEPSALEKAMEMLMLSQANTNQVLNKISETMTDVAEGIQKINDTTKATIDHQIDLDQMNKSKPFLVKIIFQVDQKTIDLWDGIYEYENTWRKFDTRKEAEAFWMQQCWPQNFRIVEVEQYMSQT